MNTTEKKKEPLKEQTNTECHYVSSVCHAEMGLHSTPGHQAGLSTHSQNALDAHSEYWGALSLCEPQPATLLHELQVWNFTLFKCINALF